MSEQISEKLSGALVPTVTIGGVAVIFGVIFGIIGFATLAAFWGFWYVLVGSIPEVWGFSRFWLDSIWGAFYLPAVVLYFTFLVDGRGNDPWVFITEHPWIVVTGIFVVIDSVVAIIFTGAAGVIGIAVSATGISFCYGIWKLLRGVDFLSVIRHFGNRER